MKVDTILGGFRKKRPPINADYRPMYKIGLIVSILDKVCIGNKSSLNKLHFFIWSLKSEKNREFIKAILESNDTAGLISWGVEPALNKALSFCIAEELITLPNDKYVLTLKGKELVKKIDEDEQLLTDEKVFLRRVGKNKVTENFINQLTIKLTN